MDYQRVDGKFSGVYLEMHQTVSTVPLPLTEKENMTIFMGIVPSTYYDRLIAHDSASFSNFATGECIEDGLKNGRLNTIKHYLTNLRVGLEVN